MSTQSQAPAAENVIVLKPRNEGRFAHTLYQEDAAELLELSREFSQARERWEKKRDYVKAALHGGARIEAGAFTFELVKGMVDTYTVDAYEYEKIVVR